MPPYPKEPHLYAFKRNGRTTYVVRAASQAEARAHVEEIEHTALARMTPTAAYIASEHGIPLLNAKPEYAQADQAAQEELFSDAAAPSDEESNFFAHEVSHDAT